MPDCKRSLLILGRVRRNGQSIAMAVMLCGITGYLADGARAGQAAAPDQQAVKEATSQFYAALNALLTGDVEPMARVWSHADDVTYMGPAGGLQVGWKQVLANWKTQAALKLGGRVAPHQVHFNVGRDIAVVHNFEKGQNTVDGKLQKISIRATNVFRKEAGQWKMIGHHTDLLPFLEK